MRSTQDSNGYWTHVFHQSDLNEARMCPEKLRTRPPLSEGSDATLIGTATHLSIEEYLKADGNKTEAELVDIAVQYVQEHWHEIRMLQVENVHQAVFIVRKTVATFWSKRHHFPLGGDIEKPFRFVAYEDQFRTIMFQGTPDYHTPGMLWDWKTSAESYKENHWKMQRYSLQPTIYAMAIREATGEIPEFTYVRFPKSGDPMEMATVTRDQGDFDGVVTQALSLAFLIEAELPRWPMRPTDWHCSPKWCETFAAGKCMGEHHANRKYSIDWMRKGETDE